MLSFTLFLRQLLLKACPYRLVGSMWQQMRPVEKIGERRVFRLSYSLYCRIDKLFCVCPSLALLASPCTSSFWASASIPGLDQSQTHWSGPDQSSQLVLCSWDCPFFQHSYQDLVFTVLLPLCERYFYIIPIRLMNLENFSFPTGLVRPSATISPVWRY